MPNWASTSYVIEGPKDTLETLKKAILDTKDNEDSLKWEPDVMDTLGIVYEHMKNQYEWPVSLRGGILPDSVRLENDAVLRFSAEEAWGRSDLIEVLKASFSGLKIFFYVEEQNEEVYATNDTEGKYFPERYWVDTCFDGQYESEFFKTEEAMFTWLSERTHSTVKSKKDVDAFNDDYEDSGCEDENFIHIYEISLIRDFQKEGE